MSHKIKERREVKKLADIEFNKPKELPKKKTVLDKIKTIFKKK